MDNNPEEFSRPTSSASQNRYTNLYEAAGGGVLVSKETVKPKPSHSNERRSAEPVNEFDDLDDPVTAELRQSAQRQIERYY